MQDQREHDYVSGKRVYRSAGHGPKPGTKDPSGYIKRESQKRSGLAQAALRMKEKMSAPANPTPQPMIPQDLTPVGSNGLMKDRTGRLYNGSPPQAQ